MSVSEVLSVFRIGTLRDHDEVDYLNFKINRREHILALSLQMLQVTDVEFKVFQCVRNATELISSELDKASNTDDQQYCMEKVRYTEGAVTVFVGFGFKVSDMAKTVASQRGYGEKKIT